MPERTDRNEALRLADELAEEAEHRVCHVAMAPASLLKDAAALLRQLSAERDQLRAEVERLRADAERLDWLQQAMSEGDEKVPDLCTDTGEFYFSYTQNGQTHCDGCSFELRRTIDHARTTHKDEG